MKYLFLLILTTVLSSCGFVSEEIAQLKSEIQPSTSMAFLENKGSSVLFHATTREVGVFLNLFEIKKEVKLTKHPFNKFIEFKKGEKRFGFSYENGYIRYKSKQYLVSQKTNEFLKFFYEVNPPNN